MENFKTILKQSQTDPSPIKTAKSQMSKMFGAGKWGALGAAVWTVVIASGVLPEPFNSNEFENAVMGLITVVGSMIGAYRAEPNGS